MQSKLLGQINILPTHSKRSEAFETLVSIDAVASSYTNTILFEIQVQYVLSKAMQKKRKKLRRHT